MTAPIYEFLTSYAQKNGVRLHMPGHKGQGPLGIEHLDITEIAGADVLSEAEGIIGESERNAAHLFGSGKTLYTTGGSTTAIFGMLALAASHFRTKEAPMILASRNAHRAFLQAAALLDIPVSFMLPKNAETVYSGVMSANEVEGAIKSSPTKPFAVYITSPSYLGEMWDISAVAAVCKSHGIPLLVDNAHGAYLAFLSPSYHPMQCGAAMCTDSAHKTLPVLTGGAYLHIGKEFPALFEDAKGTLSLFSTTSPSYLTLASLDLANPTLENGYREKLAAVCKRIALCKKRLRDIGFAILTSEPLKIVISDRGAPSLASCLRAAGIEPEFCDMTHLVLMASAENKLSDFEDLEQALTNFSPMPPQDFTAPKPVLGEQALSIRSALFAPKEEVDLSDALGRIYAEISAACPPAVPIVICGERIDEHAIAALHYYGVKRVWVVKELTEII